MQMFYSNKTNSDYVLPHFFDLLTNKEDIVLEFYSVLDILDVFK